ncbi:MAG TPA: endonuclease/exonuclease/phosphatase family protein [Chlamydiales bacterium]|nr:endonuclease/exonuclease/phosphatase family protein [Chlamydiales bacterium]
MYAPASLEPTEKLTKDKIINYLRTLTSDDTKLNVVAGDFNEDPDHHTCTNIIDTLAGNGLYNMNQNLDSADFTWKNNSGTMRMLDYIFVSNDMAALETNIATIGSLNYFTSDHRIVLTRLELDYILFNNSGQETADTNTAWKKLYALRKQKLNTGTNTRKEQSLTL